MSDPYRQAVPEATDEALTALVETGPLSHQAGRRAVFEEAQITDRIAGFITSDDRRARDVQRARVVGDGYRNERIPAAGNAAYGCEGDVPLDRLVNAARAREMGRQAQLRRYREETAAKADLSAADAIGASLVGAATDPVMIPTWFIGGGASALRAMRVAPAATRLGAVGRGAAVGVIDGLTGGAAAEGLTAAARLGTGEDYSFTNDGIRNLLFGAALGGGVGAVAGGVTHTGIPQGRRLPVDDQIMQAARARGVNPDLAVRIRQLENITGSATARPIRAGRRLSSAHGIFQITDGTWSSLGGGDRNSVSRQIELGVENIAREQAGLQAALGRPPEPWQVYLAHQQGQGGARALLGNPDGDAVAVLTPELERGNPGKGAQLARQAVLNNGGRIGMTAGDFANLWRAKFGGGPTLEALTPARPPRVLEGLTENERAGAFAEAIEAMAEDAPVSLGPLLARDGLALLDEASAVPSINGRWLEADTAVTRRGAEVPVRFAVVELRDLKTSHDDDLFPIADYPGQLQPRDRTRAGSQAANFELERDLNPALLMRDKAASGGAPIVSPDGVVESGNGRTIALRRSAQTGTEAWARYTAELERQGIDTTGFDRPVLVRMRTEPMTGADRAELARSLNEAPTEAFSPVEQARGDARRVDADLIGLIEGDDVFAAANRPFLRGFVQRVAPGDANALTDARGVISTAGRTRVQAALVQAAYGDDALTAALFETTDAGMRGVGQALADAAPAWAKMRAEAPAELDLTPALTSAVALMREARNPRNGAGRMSMGELLETRLGQLGLFGGEAITPETEAMIRLMYRDEALTKPRGSERIADALRTYARGAAETPAGPDLFGATPDGKAFLDTLIQKYAGAEGEGRTGLAYAGGDEPLWSTRELARASAEPAGLDLRPAEPDGQGPGGTRQQPEGQRGADATGRQNEGQSARVVGFKTAKGSSYRVELDGTTTRDKAYRPEHGLAEQGAQPTSQKTFYVAADALPRLGEFQSQGGPRVAMVDDGNANLALRYVEGPDVGKIEKRTVVSAKTEPAVGLYPVEIWKDGMRVHFGNEIVEITPAPAQSVERGALTPEARVAAFIDADPELKALVADTEALAAEAGVRIEPSTGAGDPSTVAEAIRAAAVCLASDIVA